MTAVDSRDRTELPPRVVRLAEAHRYGTDVLGGKAAALARQAAAGLPVPDGFVVTTAALAAGDWEPEVTAAAALVGADRYAVRSSARAEDGAEASFAGLFVTVLEVPAADLAGAIRRCASSAGADTVSGYRRRAAARQHGQDPGGPSGGDLGDDEPGRGEMAVLVQAMVRPVAAGVAFTADPRTGDRDTTVVTAVRGLGERLVSGEAVGDEWVVVGGSARCRRSTERALDEPGALAVAALAHRAAAVAGVPQDVEWAWDGTAALLLQARPITALPDPVAWNPPGPGSWLRNFRFGEWLPEPLTPLFADWLLPCLERGLADGMARQAGAAVRFPHGQVNGWYYAAHPRPAAVLGAVLRGRSRLLRYLRVMLFLTGKDPRRAHELLLDRLARQWRGEFLPRYRASVGNAGARVDRASQRELVELVEELGGLAGQQMFWISAVGGAAWKMEGALAGFLRDRLGEPGAGETQWLLSGLDPGGAGAAGATDHAVHTLDWVRPTLGETGLAVPELDPRRRQALVARREQAERGCREALAAVPADLERFDTVLGLARTYASMREEQARLLTLGWPVLRRAALRLGRFAQAAGAIDDPADVFFLTRAELLGTRAELPGPEQPAAGQAQQRVRQRRERWERQRRLSPPLTLGPPEKLAEKVLDATVEAVRVGASASAGAGGRSDADAVIVGHPASPGRATGPARLVRGPEDFARFVDGDVLVAQATAPAWTPLFARAAAVVTDGGTLAAHASLIAREYAIPAVVGTGDATARIRDRQMVTVDGSGGVVELAARLGEDQAGTTEPVATERDG